eukprot:jgi/Tetstr1/453480/TSEL_003971.t1
MLAVKLLRRCVVPGWGQTVVLHCHQGMISSTVEAFLDLVAKTFSPTPEIAELSFSLDFSEWSTPDLQDRVRHISKPHRFEFTCDDAVDEPMGLPRHAMQL